MTWAGRLKLTAGLIVVLLIVAVSTLAFNQRITAVTSQTAQIDAESYPVGTDYGGMVTRSYVAEGDTVAAGDPMFDVRSLVLENALKVGAVSTDTTTIHPDGTVTIRASVAGTVTKVNDRQGAYAQGGSVMATIARTGTLFASAEFVLSPRDFGRLQKNAAVDLTLPDSSTLKGTLDSFDVQTVQGEAQVTAVVKSPGLSKENPAGLIQPGTPLVATLHLRDDGPLAGLTDAWRGFLARAGL